MRKLSTKDITTMVSIITVLVVGMIMVLIFSACSTFSELEKQPTADRQLTFIQVHRIVTVENKPALAPQTRHKKVDEFGIDNESFKYYVMKKIEGTDYEYFTFESRTLVTGEERFSKAYVYYKKKKK